MTEEKKQEETKETKQAQAEATPKAEQPSKGGEPQAEAKEEKKSDLFSTHNLRNTISHLRQSRKRPSAMGLGRDWMT